MPVFKVTLDDRSKKVTVSAKTLESLREKAIQKLELDLEASLCQVIDESDGSIIDDDDCLLDMALTASNSGGHLTLIIQQLGGTWKKRSELNENHCLPATPPPSRPSTPIVDTPTTSCVSNANSKSQSKTTVHPSIDSYTKELKKALEAPEHVRNKALRRARRSVANNIAKYFHATNNDAGDVRSYAEKLWGSCTEAFAITIKDSTVSNGLDPFIKSIYNMIGYMRGQAGITIRSKRGRKRKQDERSEDEDSPDEVPNICLDSNGCAEGMWSPVLPSNETNESQEEKKSLLLNYNTMPGCEIDGNVEQLFKDTYSLQRKEINSARTLEEARSVFAGWPMLLKPTFLYIHCNLLLGKNVTETWYKELGCAPFFLTYMERYCEQQEINPSKKSLFSSMNDYITKARCAEKSLHSQQPVSLVMFPLLVAYMKESQSDLFIVLQGPNSDMTEEARSKSLCPLLVVKGSSLFDSTAECAVVIRGEFAVPVSNPIEGFLVVVLSYFAFNIAYPRKIAKSLEFIQRFLLKINPEKSARVEGAAMKTSSINALVARLATALQDFENLKSRWSMADIIT